MNRPLQSRRTGLRNATAAIAAALTLAFAANAPAQPAGPHGPHAGHAGQRDLLAGALQKAHDQLNLNTSQQLAWDNAVAATKATHEARINEFLATKAVLDNQVRERTHDVSEVDAKLQAAS